MLHQLVGGINLLHFDLQKKLEAGLSNKYFITGMCCYLTSDLPYYDEVINIKNFFRVNLFW